MMGSLMRQLPRGELSLGRAALGACSLAVAVACTHDYSALDVSGLSEDAGGSTGGTAMSSGGSGTGSGGASADGAANGGAGGTSSDSGSGGVAAGGGPDASPGGTDGGATGGVASTGGDTGDSSTSGGATSAGDASATGGVTGTGGATPDAAAPSCASLYGAATGYVLCAETAKECRFAATTGGGGCDSVCTSLGGTCIDQDDNGSQPCAVSNTGTSDTCTTPRQTAICVCSRP